MKKLENDRKPLSIEVLIEVLNYFSLSDRRITMIGTGTRKFPAPQVIQGLVDIDTQRYLVDQLQKEGKEFCSSWAETATGGTTATPPRTRSRTSSSQGENAESAATGNKRGVKNRNREQGGARREELEALRSQLMAEDFISGRSFNAAQVGMQNSFYGTTSHNFMSTLSSLDVEPGSPKFPSSNRHRKNQDDFANTSKIVNSRADNTNASRYVPAGGKTSVTNRRRNMYLPGNHEHDGESTTSPNETKDLGMSSTVQLSYDEIVRGGHQLKPLEPITVTAKRFARASRYRDHDASGINEEGQEGNQTGAGRVAAAQHTADEAAGGRVVSGPSRSQHHHQTHQHPRSLGASSSSNYQQIAAQHAHQALENAMDLDKDEIFLLHDLENLHMTDTNADAHPSDSIFLSSRGAGAPAPAGAITTTCAPDEGVSCTTRDHHHHHHLREPPRLSVDTSNGAAATSSLGLGTNIGTCSSLSSSCGAGGLSIPDALDQLKFNTLVTTSSGHGSGAGAGGTMNKRGSLNPYTGVLNDKYVDARKLQPLEIGEKAAAKNPQDVDEEPMMSQRTEASSIQLLNSPRDLLKNLL
ncbi:unnamed protein product [Amoebophrya sp. A120]|nr:unnamed protein product [Amoebophrya sp. A120]|eukprot:GSA120T00013988001.1